MRDQKPSPPPSTCPSCGHCPTCGHTPGYGHGHWTNPGIPTWADRTYSIDSNGNTTYPESYTSGDSVSAGGELRTPV